jgi:RNAse (barnase) inhibitor barstar
MKRIEFLEAPLEYSNDTEFVAQISRVKGKSELLSELNKVLNFPDYFGYNWEALSDCLRDFSWIKEKGIALIHSEIPNLTNGELKVYIEIIYDAVQDWKVEEAHYLKIIFPQKAEHIIQELIKDYL